MIVRIWKGRITSTRSEEYVAIVERTGMAGYRETAGNNGAQILTRDLSDGTTEIMTISWWASLDHIRAFAGEDIETAMYYPEDDDYLIDQDDHVTHHVVKSG